MTAFLLALLLLVFGCAGPSPIAQSIAVQNQQLSKESQAIKQELLDLDDSWLRYENEEKYFLSTLTDSQIEAYINLLAAWKERNQPRGVMAWRRVKETYSPSQLARLNDLMTLHKSLIKRTTELTARINALNQRQEDLQSLAQFYLQAMEQERTRRALSHQQQAQASNEALRRYEDDIRWNQLIGAIQNLKNSP